MWSPWAKPVKVVVDEKVPLSMLYSYPPFPPATFPTVTVPSEPPLQETGVEVDPESVSTSGSVTVTVSVIWQFLLSFTVIMWSPWANPVKVVVDEKVPLSMLYSYPPFPPATFPTVTVPSEPPLQETGVKVDPESVSTSGSVTVMLSEISQPLSSVTVIV